MRKGHEIESGERTVSLYELAKLFGVAYQTLQGRWRRGDRGERLTRPSDPRYSRKGRW